jgi:hypothetical protein
MWTPDQRSSTRLLLISLGALTLGSVPIACSAEADILSKRKGTDGVGGSSGTEVDGGGGNLAGGTKSGVGAQGNAAAGSAGNAGSGAAAGAVGGASTAGSTGTAGPTGAGDSTHIAEKKQLVEALCSVLDEHPCVSWDQTAADERVLCSQVNQIDAATVPDDCFDEWAAEMKCLASWNWQCPCTGSDCILLFPLELLPEETSASNRCPTEERAYSNCGTSTRDYGSTTGSVRRCNWDWDPASGCDATCVPTDDRLFTADCLAGVPGGPQLCSCRANSTYLNDGPNPDKTSFYADDCAGIAQKMSDGQCDRILDCCFTWVPKDAPGTTSTERCDCTSDPMKVGASTCAEVAALGGGKVVDICPQYAYRSPPVFPEPDAGK